MPLSFLITIFVMRVNYNSSPMPAIALLSLQTFILGIKMVIRMECHVKTELTLMTVGNW